MLIEYIGPMDSVDIPALRVRAERGVPVDVADPDAAILLAQVDNWAASKLPVAKKEG